MADHRAEQIMDAVVAKLTGLATTGANVTRGRVYNIERQAIPHLSIYRGENRPVADADQNMAFSDWVLAVNIEAVVKSATSQIDEVLAQIEKEVTIALKADRTQGLEFVLDTMEAGSSEPALDGDGDQPVATMIMQFLFKYRRSITDPSQ